MIKITFTIGIEKDKEGKSIAFVDQVMFTKRACYMVARAFGGYTAVVGAGGWIAPNGEMIEETSLSISAVTDAPGNRKTTKQLAETFKVMFNQACIMVTRDVCQMEMI